MFTPDPIPRPTGPPASSTPLGDYLTGVEHSEGRYGVDSGYVVLPRSLVESLPLPWQQHMRRLLTEFHEAFGYLSWPVYRVVPSRYERLVDLDDDQLAEVGCTVEVADSGELEYRQRDGSRISDPETRRVLVSCSDPIQPPGSGAGSAPPPAPPAR
ncbi:hypothetical protein DFQ14_11014 [Halopolyspora algeriensis]|uniref:Uncharacterized protein n=1 Tax=Halopolyspora algeriensis TaxID=1500506 RepID=A0A368VHI5_9ACTN|nr:hypothetical protein [Halopolyspora algeriensis]RCW40690.1 hypothetical protein DFQ14_11014 [Halopolyspora algeriensis]TQM53387.1 hypothetical protein FHU43_2784 [Halopolyspora algeriensis]